MGNYRYAFIIYTPAQWTVLGNVAQVVPPTNIGAYTVNSQEAWYLYEALKATFAAYKQHKDASVRMIIHIFGNYVFLNLQDVHQHLVGYSPLELLAYLKTTYVTDTQKRDDITAIDTKIRPTFLMDMMIETYFNNLTSC